MPELVHGENILLADSSEEIAELIAEVGADRQLRRRIGRAGLKTLRELFHPGDAVSKMASDMRQLVFRGAA